MNVAQKSGPSSIQDLTWREGTEKWGSRVDQDQRDVLGGSLGKAFSFLGMEEKAVNRLGCWVWGEAGQLY